MHRLRSLARALAVAALVLAAPVVSAQTVTNLYVGGDPVHFSFATGVVPDSLVTDTNWDLQIAGTDIKPNGIGVLLAQKYDDLAEAPAEGYQEGGIRSAKGDRWYNYDQQAHFLWPLPDHTLVFLLRDGRYAKMEISSYYHSETEEVRYMTFRYAATKPGVRTF